MLKMKKVWTCLIMFLGFMVLSISVVASDKVSYKPFSIEPFNGYQVEPKNQEAEHEFSRTDKKDNVYETDICSKCGYERMHETDRELYFVTVKDKVVERAEPRKKGRIINKIQDKDTQVIIVGRIRNEHNNLWLMTDSGGYICSDNLAFCFDYEIMRAIQYCDFGKESERTLAAIYDNFNSGARFDLKDMGLLGANPNTSYRIKVANEIIDEKYTGEQLGNILYGCIARWAGFDEESAIQMAGVSISLAEKKYISAAVCLFDSAKCDDEDDIEMIKKGISYWDTFVW